MIPDTAGTPKKEDTILELTEGISKVLDELEVRLDGHFLRSGRVSEKKPQAPMNQNVLDEIIDRLTENRAHLQRIMSFISSEVLPKIN